MGGFGYVGRKGGFGCGWMGGFGWWFAGGDAAGGVEAAWGLLLEGRGPLRHDATAPLADCCVFVFKCALKRPNFHYIVALLL